VRFPIGDGASLEQLDADPHALLARLREQEPVSWLPALDGWLITRRDIAMQVMRDPETFTVDDPRFSTGVVVGPVVAAQKIGLDLMWTGLIAGTIAYLVHRLREARRKRAS